METVPKLIVFITGSFLSNHCWDEWMSYFESRGYECIAPAWPNKEEAPEQLRNSHPIAAIATMRLTTLLNYFVTVVNTLPDKPILIGHSLGGLIVQLLLQRELGSAGVAIHSFPPRGVRIKLSFLKAIWETMGFFTATKATYMISFKKWKHAVANEMSCDQQIALYYGYAIPESKLVIRDAFKSITKIDFSKSRPPLLLTSGGQDKMIPALLNYRNYKKYGKGNSITNYKIFKDRNHLVFGQPSWREDADFILNWLEGLK